MKKLNQEDLIRMGFEKELWYDKNDPEEQVNDLMFCSWTYKIPGTCAVEVCLAYRRNDKDWQWFETSTNLVYESTTTPVALEYTEQVDALIQLLSAGTIAGQSTCPACDRTAIDVYNECRDCGNTWLDEKE